MLQDKLALLLAGVKLFLANFPFFYSCFLTNIAEIKCGDTFDEAGIVLPFFGVERSASQWHFDENVLGFSSGDQLVVWIGLVWIGFLLEETWETNP